MHPRSKLSAGDQRALVDLFEAGFYPGQASRELGVARRSAESLFNRWLVRGRLCLVKRRQRVYSREFKREVVHRFLAGEKGLDLAREYDLSGVEIISGWTTMWRKYGEEAFEEKFVPPRGPGKPRQMSRDEYERQRRLEFLEAENAYLKKLWDLRIDSPSTRQKVEIIAVLKSDHRLDLLLRAGRVARSTFYYHLGKLDRPDKHAQLKKVIVELFDRSHGRAGYRMIRMLLHRQGWKVSRKLVCKLMRVLGLRARRVVKAYNSYRGTVARIAANVLDRRFYPDVPNQRWVSDVTEFRVGGRKLYLAPVMDLCDRSILSYTIASGAGVDIVTTALERAMTTYQPGQGLIVHSDQGFHYQHRSWTRLIENAQGIQSMSRKGNCWDNAVMENFFGHLKSDVYINERYTHPQDLITAIEDYIAWWNTERPQQGLGQLTPTERRNQAFLGKAA